MTTAEILASLEAQIRKDIPRLTELSEGCVLLNKSNKDKFEIIDIDTDFYEYVCLKNKKHITSIAFKNINLFEIIGHDIMLNDVLEWLNYIIYEKCIPINDLGYSGMVKQFYVKGDDGSIIFEILDLKNPDLGLDTIRYGVWNLPSIYLKDQSEELIKFLYNIKINKVMETLKDIFVPYEIAVQLKEIGFDEKCIASYTSAKNIIFELYDLTRHAFKEDLIIDDFNSSDRCISAPSYEQVKKWFREKEIDGDIRISYPAVNNYHFKIVDFREAMEYRSEIFNNYEEARGQLILKLIGIYKNEQDI